MQKNSERDLIRAILLPQLKIAFQNNHYKVFEAVLSNWPLSKGRNIEIDKSSNTVVQSVRPCANAKDVNNLSTDLDSWWYLLATAKSPFSHHQSLNFTYSDLGITIPYAEERKKFEQVQAQKAEEERKIAEQEAEKVRKELDNPLHKLDQQGDVEAQYLLVQGYYDGVIMMVIMTCHKIYTKLLIGFKKQWTMAIKIADWQR